MEREIRNDEQELGEAINLGTQRRPRQSFGSYFEGRQASCALGAAYDGMYRIPAEATPAVYRDLYRLFDCLDYTIRTSTASSTVSTTRSGGVPWAARSRSPWPPSSCT